MLLIIIMSVLLVTWSVLIDMLSGLHDINYYYVSSDRYLVRSAWYYDVSCECCLVSSDNDM